MAPTISVCFTVTRSPEQAAAAITLARPMAAEIVVVVADGVDVDSLRPVADRLVATGWDRFGSTDTSDLAWTDAEFASEWILHLGGDEVPSSALISRLEEGGWDVDLTHILIPRRWVWLDGVRALDEQPWHVDLQPRLVRNLPGLVRSDPTTSATTGGVTVAGWSAAIDEPIYSLALTSEVAHRRDLARRWERRRPGQRLPGGWSRPIGLLVPEDLPGTPATVAIAEPDRGRIASVLAIAPTPAADPGRRLSTGHGSSGRPAGIEAPRRSTSTPPGPGDGSVDLAGPLPSEWVAGREVELTVRLHNASDQTWRPDDEPPVRVGLRFFVEKQGQDRAVGHEARIDLTGPVAPGSDAVLSGRIVVPADAGKHRLDIDLVREHVGWFGRAISADVDVVPPRRIAVTGGFSPYRHLGDDLIFGAVLAALAEHLPDDEVVVLADDPAGATARYGPPAVQGANPLLHRSRPAGTTLALRRVAALRRDAVRFRRGEVVLDPMHGPLLAGLATCDVLVAPGAGWFTSKYRIEQMLPRLAEVEAARALGIPVLFESGTVGPFDSHADRLLARRLLAGVERVTVRDGERSASTARGLGADHVIEVPDAATASQPDDGPAARRWLADRGIDPDGPYAIVSVRDTQDPTAVGDSDATLDTLVGALDTVAAAGIAALFLPHCIAAETDDRPAGRAVAARTALSVDDSMPPDDVAVALISSAALTVGNRFHLALVADAAGTPGLFLASTPFDALRSGAFTGGNIDVVQAQTGGHAGQAAAQVALTRGRGEPSPHWDGVSFAEAVHQAAERTRRS